MRRESIADAAARPRAVGGRDMVAAQLAISPSEILIRHNLLDANKPGRLLLDLPKTRVLKGLTRPNEFSCFSLRLEQFGYVLPTHNPLRVAEHAATIDHLLGGRFVTIGRTATLSPSPEREAGASASTRLI